MNSYGFWVMLKDHVVKCNHNFIVHWIANILMRINFLMCINLHPNVENRLKVLENIYGITRKIEGLRIEGLKSLNSPIPKFLNI